MNEERLLVNRCLKGERKAQYELYRRYSGKMYGVCLRYGKNVQEAQDILQEGFILIFKKLHTFRFEGSLEGWIRRLIISAALEWLRKHKNNYLNNELKEDSIDCVAPESAIDEIEIDELNKKIRSLPPGFRMVFNMYAIEGYSHKEIAEALNISVSASKSQYSRAKQQLLTKMGEKYKQKDGKEQ